MASKTFKRGMRIAATKKYMDIAISSFLEVESNFKEFTSDYGKWKIAFIFVGD